jgi:hypothetical protein
MGRVKEKWNYRIGYPRWWSLGDSVVIHPEMGHNRLPIAGCSSGGCWVTHKSLAWISTIWPFSISKVLVKH